MRAIHVTLVPLERLVISFNPQVVLFVGFGDSPLTTKLASFRANQEAVCWISMPRAPFNCKDLLGNPSITVHPGRLTWNIIMEVWKIIFLSKWVICRFHVNLPGCNHLCQVNSQNSNLNFWVHPAVHGDSPSGPDCGCCVVGIYHPMVFHPGKVWSETWISLIYTYIYIQISFISIYCISHIHLVTQSETMDWNIMLVIILRIHKDCVDPNRKVVVEAQRMHYAMLRTFGSSTDVSSCSASVEPRGPRVSWYM